MSVTTRSFDAARYLETEEEIEEYLVAMSENGDPAEIAHALGVIARARGMTGLAERTGLTRQSLYKALGEGGNPEFSTIAKVAEALGFKIRLVPASKMPRNAA
jgi:probable addiction module antidote protein